MILSTGIKKPLGSQVVYFVVVGLAPDTARRPRTHLVAASDLVKSFLLN
ncbi:MAG TPA: hypothetical protein VE574_01015 [Nitrososphaeraceae archaeon]|nr:hypothetical protein [Nitrososphaeraceae archaeon]